MATGGAKFPISAFSVRLVAIRSAAYHKRPFCAPNWWRRQAFALLDRADSAGRFVLRNFINACWFAFKWGLLAALLAAVGLGLYFYGRLNDEIRIRVQAKFAAAYPNLSVTIRSAQLVEGQGIEVRGLSISDPRLAGAPAELAYFDEVLFCCQTSLAELIKHEPKITRIIVRRPRLQAARLPDGAWSISQLLPIPKLSDHPAEVQLENGQFIVFDSQRNPPITYNLHDINLSLKPAGDVAAADVSTYELRTALAADHVQQVQVTGQLNRTTGAIDLNGAVNGIDISPELMAALPPDDAARLQPLAPLRGQANLQFHVWRDPAQAGPWQFDVAGELMSGRFDDTRLPQALADLRAKFHADNRGFQITDLTAHNGPTALRWTARVDGYQPGSPMMIEGEALHLLVGPLWEPLLPPQLLEQWQKFQPAGEVNVKGAQAVFDGVHWQLQATVECLNVSMMYHKFPYRVEHGNGSLHLSCDPNTHQNRLTMDLTAFAGSRPVKIEGQFFNPGPEFTGGLTISGTAIPFDQNLYNAISAVQPKASEVVQSLHLGGGFNFRVDCVRDDPSSKNMHQHLQVDLDHCLVRYDRFPYPLSNVVGRLEMIDGQWLFRGLEGENHTGHVTCDGSVTPVAQGVSLQLEFHGRDMVLEEELRDALPPRMQPIWNDMKPKGSFNLLKSEVSFTSIDKQLKVSAQVQPVGETVSIDPTYFPYRLEKVGGTVTFAEDRCDFQNLRAVHDRTPISANGFCEHGPDGAVPPAFRQHYCRSRAAGYRPRHDHRSTGPAAKSRCAIESHRTHQPARNAGLLGPASAAVAQRSAPAVLGDCRVVSQWQNMQFDIEEGTLHTGVEVENIHGGGVFSGSFDPGRAEGQRLITRGELNVDSLTWNSFQFTNVAGPVYLDDRQVIVGSDADPQPTGARAARAATCSPKVTAEPPKPTPPCCWTMRRATLCKPS